MGTTKISEGGVIHDISKTIMHKRFRNNDTRTYIWDIALIKTQENILFNENVKPLKLPEKRLEQALEHSYLLAGWGDQQVSYKYNSCKNNLLETK